VNDEQHRHAPHTMTPPNPLTCPHCGGPFPYARALADEGHAEPRDGDYAVCGGCGQVSMLVLDEDGMDLRKPSAAEVTHFLVCHVDHALVAWQALDQQRGGGATGEYRPMPDPDEPTTPPTAGQ
jgi:hypothetical protein